MKQNIKGYAAKRIYNRASKALLREQIHSSRRQLDTVSKELFYLHLKLTTQVTPELWDTVDGLTFNCAEIHGFRTTDRQKKKYNKLEGTKEPRIMDTNKIVVNLSKYPLSDVAITALSKGNNFSVAPTKIPTEEIINQVESSIRVLSQAEAEEIRSETCRILRKAKPLKSNITRNERQELKKLKENKEVIVISADKGNATVVMNTDEYEEKIKEILKPETYSVKARDPTNTVERKTINLLKETDWEQDLIKQLKPSNSLPPRLYGLPKIHKQGVPLRPIVSSIGSPTYKLAKHLATLLKSLVGQSEHHIKNSKQFIDIIKTIKLEETDILVSFDVESLFTKVPLAETLVLLRPHFDPPVINLFQHCLTSSYFIWKGTFYEQTDGVAMGSPLSPVLANFFMEDFEVRALQSAEKKPKHWFRYVDDTFVVWQHGRESLQIFLDHLNGIHSNIKFTMETENNNALPFLDVLIKKKSNGDLGHEVTRKPT